MIICVSCMTAAVAVGCISCLPILLDTFWPAKMGKRPKEPTTCKNACCPKKSKTV